MFRFFPFLMLFLHISLMAQDERPPKFGRSLHVQAAGNISQQKCLKDKDFQCNNTPLPGAEVAMVLRFSSPDSVASIEAEIGYVHRNLNIFMEFDQNNIRYIQDGKATRNFSYGALAIRLGLLPQRRMGVVLGFYIGTQDRVRFSGSTYTKSTGAPSQGVLGPMDKIVSENGFSIACYFRPKAPKLQYLSPELFVRHISGGGQNAIALGSKLMIGRH